MRLTAQLLCHCCCVPCRLPHRRHLQQGRRQLTAAQAAQAGGGGAGCDGLHQQASHRQDTVCAVLLAANVSGGGRPHKGVLAVCRPHMASVCKGPVLHTLLVPLTLVPQHVCVLWRVSAHAGRATTTMLTWRMTSYPSCRCGVQRVSPCMAAAGSSATAGQRTGTISGVWRGTLTEHNRQGPPTPKP